MTDKINTSTEAVERLCRDIHDGITCGEILPVDGVGIQDILRALAAERDAFRAVLNGMEYRIDDSWLAEHGEEGGFALGQEAKRIMVNTISERDALQSRLTEARNEALDEAYNALFVVPAASQEQEHMAQRCQSAIRALKE